MNTFKEAKEVVANGIATFYYELCNSFPMDPYIPVLEDEVAYALGDRYKDLASMDWFVCPVWERAKEIYTEMRAN